MQDDQIIALYFARDERAIGETAARYGNYCRAVAFGILENDADAQEVVNDAYLQVWNSVPPIVPDPLKTYLAVIINRLALNRLEAQMAQKRGGGKMELLFDELAEVLPEKSGEIVDRIALRDCLNAFLDALPKKTRIIFVRRYFYAQSTAAIAAQMHMSDTAVRNALLRTRKKLKQHLEKEGFTV